MPTTAVRRPDVTAQAFSMMAYKPEDGDDQAMELYDDLMSIWHVSSARVSYFVSTVRRYEVTNGQKALGEKYLTIALTRVGSLLFQLALCMRFKGIAAYSASPPSGITVASSGVLDAAANGAQVQPYLCDYAGPAALLCSEMNVGSHKMLEISNAAQVVIEELHGSAGHNGKKMSGKHAENPVAPWDAAKFEQLIIVPMQFFFCKNTGSALPMSAVGFHSAECIFSLADLDAVLVKPDVTLAQAGGTGSTALYGSTSTQFDVYLRDESVAWDTVPTVKASSANILGDVYLLATVVSLPIDESDSILAQAITQNITKYETTHATQYMSTPPTADYEYTHKINVKRAIDAIYIVPRQRGSYFADMFAAAPSFAPTRPTQLLTNMGVEVDGHKIFDCPADENQLNYLWQCGQNTDLPIMVAAWSQDTSLDIAVGSLYANSALEVVVKATIAKEAWTTTVKNVDLDFVVQYKEPMTIAFGMLELTH